MKDFTIRASFIPHLNAVQCTMPTADYEIWLQEEGKIFSEISEKVVHDDAVTTITLSVHWFEICKRYCRILFDIQTHDSPDIVLSTGSGRVYAA